MVGRMALNHEIFVRYEFPHPSKQDVDGCMRAFQA